MSKQPPTLAEINVYDSLDERSAAEHFFGKDLEQAKALFHDNFIKYQEDLMWMGPRAFCYYVDAAIAYLLSSSADGNSDAANCFCGVVEFQLENNGSAVAPARSRIRNAIVLILQDFPRYHCDPRIYGDLESRYRLLETRLR